MSAPKIPDQKSESMPVNVNPLQAKVGATQPLPRQMFNSQRPSLGAELAGQAPQSGRYDPRIAMELLKRGQGGM